MEPALYQPSHVLRKIEDEPVLSNRIIEELQSMGSVATHVLLSDILGLKNPGAHGLHLGWLVVVPGSLVNLPAGHFVWAVQE